jgi:LysR family carnitine catabolism transcriptional activator
VTAALRHLKCFVEVAVWQSVSKAAIQLNVSQSALTLTLQQLEASIGVRLFDRTTRTLLLTAAGEEFLPTAQRLLEDFDSALGKMRELGVRARGHVSIAVVPSIMAFIIPQALGKFMKLHPGVTVHLREDSSNAAEERVLNREVDFGITSPSSRRSNLNYTPLFEDQFAVVFGDDHPLAKMKRVRWRDLDPYHVIGFSQDSRLAMQVRQMQSETVPEHVRNPRCRVSHTGTIESLVNQGLGICALPCLSAKRVPLNKLQCRLLEEPAYHRQICLLQPDQRSLSPAAGVLLDLILEEMPRLAEFEGVRMLI